MADMDDTDDTDDTEDQPAMPTSADDAGDDTNAPSNMQDDDDDDQDQSQDQQTGAPVPQVAPGAAQSNGGAASELMSLVRAVNAYGLRMAQQGSSQPQGQQPQGQQGQTPSYEFGGLVRSYADGGAIPTDKDDDAPEQAQQAPAAGTPDPPQDQSQQPQGEQEQPLQFGGAKGMTTPFSRGVINALSLKNLPGNAKAIWDRATAPGDKGAEPQPNVGEDEAKPAIPMMKGGADMQSMEDTGAPKPGIENLAGNVGKWGQRVGNMAKDVASNWNQFPQNAANIIKYLKGDGAMDGNTAAAISYAVDPHGALPPVERELKKVQYAYQKGLTEGGDPRTAMQLALGVMQQQRQKFDMWRTAAAVKLDKSDMGSAVDAANKAFQAPFGDNIHFTQSQGGVTATVTGAKGEVQGTFPMQATQFQALLKQHGKFDNLIQNGLFNTFAGLSSPAPRPNQGNGTIGTNGGWSRGTPDQQAQAGKTQEGDYPISQAPAGVDQKTFDASNRMFPWVSQNTQREQWIAQQQEQQAGRTNKVDIAAAGNNGRNYRAELSNQTRRDVNANTQEHQDQRTSERESGRNERFDKGWEHRIQAAVIKQAGQNRNDPANGRKTAVVKQLLSEHSGDPAGFRAALKEAGIDYERDILGKGQAQQAPQAAAGSPARSGATMSWSQSPGAGVPSAAAAPQVGTVKNGYTFKGGDPADRNSWERASAQ